MRGHLRLQRRIYPGFKTISWIFSSNGRNPLLRTNLYHFPLSTASLTRRNPTPHCRQISVKTHGCRTLTLASSLSVDHYRFPPIRTAQTLSALQNQKADNQHPPWPRRPINCRLCRHEDQSGKPQPRERLGIINPRNPSLAVRYGFTMLPCIFRKHLADFVSVRTSSTASRRSKPRWTILQARYVPSFTTLASLR
jgi:hypothetical protein